MKKNVLAIVGLMLLTSCGGGGGSGGGGGNPGAIIPQELLPLNVSLKDLSNNNIPVIDISKKGSHLQYKLTLTNPNNVAITLIKNAKIGVDTVWVDYQKQLHGESYAVLQNPNFDAISEYFTKTNHNDDCMNISSINPGNSCSFYVLAVNFGKNTTNQDTFSFPLQYDIYQTNLPANILKVRQCDYDYPSDTFSCLNASKPGFRNQFISYKTIPINGHAPEAVFVTHLNGFSKSGRYIYMCDDNYRGINCGRYPLNYDTHANRLTIGVSESLFTLPGARSGYPAVTSDGSTAWYAMLSGSGSYSGVVNSNRTATIYNVPNIEYSGCNGAVVGLDGSFWWGVCGTVNVNSSIYDKNADKFIETNISAPIAQVNQDGVVIALASCWRKIGNNHTSYVPQDINNYVYKPGIGRSAITLGNSIFIDMEVPGIVDSHGKQIMIPLRAWYKIHTKNGKCEIHLDDYTMSGALTDLWTMGWGFITSSTNTYSGK